MSRLLSADFARLFKNKYFWICSIFMAGFGVFMQVMNYVSCVSNNTVPHPDTILPAFCCPLLSVFSLGQITATVQCAANLSSDTRGTASISPD